MKHTRREFVRDMAIAGAMATAGEGVFDDAAGTAAASPAADDERCPYFDQPMYCRGLSADGRPLCGK